MKIKTRITRIVFISVFLSAYFFVVLYSRVTARSPQHPLSQADALIAEVNSRRAANGLPAYQINSALMAAAQAHSDYQASIGSATHTGAGGSRPADRAVAAGYGGGAHVNVTENIYSGMNVSPATAVDWWIADGGWHLQGVLSSTYQDVGAGVGIADNKYYYTLDVGVVAGAAPQANSASGNQANVTKAAVVKPMALATAAADGSIVHVVQSGQTLWTIAAKYNIPLQELLTLNQLNQNSFLHPGDKVVVKPSSTPGAAQPPENETPPPVAETNIIPPSPETIATGTPVSSPLPSPSPVPQTLNTGAIDPRKGIAAILIGLAALIAVLVLSIWKRED